MDWIAWLSSGEDSRGKDVFYWHLCVCLMFFFFFLLILFVCLSVAHWDQFLINWPGAILKMSCYVLMFSRADLLGVYEQVILTDIELSDSQNVDQALWKNVFYQVIERFRQLLKDPTFDNTPHIRNMLLTLLDEVRTVLCEIWPG